ncbi:MAG: lamin tail domain-containing protein [Patescibacteria group bacterium]|jgi:hypothetical protein
MKNFFKKFLVYMVATVLVVPSWLVLDLLTVQKAGAFEAADSIANYLVISEVKTTSGTGRTTDEFVEIYNPTNEGIVMAKWRLSKQTASGAESNLVTDLNGMVPAMGHYLIAHNDYTGAISPDQIYTTSNSIASDNAVILYSDAGDTIVDKVGIGLANNFEGLAAVNPGANQSIERKSGAAHDESQGNGRDTGDNSTDFFLQAVPNPENSSSVIKNTNTGLAYSAIQSALTSASASDILSAIPGIYAEALTIDKSLTVKSIGSSSVSVSSIDLKSTGFSSSTLGTAIVNVSSPAKVSEGVALAKTDGTINLLSASYPTDSLTISKSLIFSAANPIVLSSLTLDKDIQSKNVSWSSVTVNSSADPNSAFVLLSATGSMKLGTGDFSAKNIVLGGFPETISIDGNYHTVHQIVLDQKLTISKLSADLISVTPKGSIQTAIDTISNEGTITVGKGDYSECLVSSVDKAYTITGEQGQMPVLNVDGSTNPIFWIKDGTVLINNLKMIDDFAPTIYIDGGAKHSIKNSVILGDSRAIHNVSSEAVDAVANYWGVGGPEALGVIVGPGLVRYAPWYTDEGLTTLKISPTVTATGSEITVDTKLTTEITTSNGIEVSVEIPSGTKINGPTSWDGTVLTGKTAESKDVAISTPGNIPSNLSAIEFGAESKSLIFSNPIKLTIKNSSDKLIGFVGTDGFVPITTICDSSSAPTNIVGNGECKIAFGTDLIIWTKHFTKFVTYSETTVSNPIFTAVSTLKSDGNYYIHVEWKGTGADQYLVKVNNLTQETVTGTATDALITYSRDYKVLDNQKYSVLVTAKIGQTESVNGVSKTIETPKIVVAQTAVTQTIVTEETTPKISVAPQFAIAAPAPAETKPAVQTPSDDDGIIKGDETSEESPSTNWTPWIVLFALILLAGAATGGYFYWFSGKEEMEKVAKVQVREKTQVSKKTSSKAKKPTNKKKRW